MSDAEPHLNLVNPSTGEVSPQAPPYSEALRLLQELETAVRMLERDLQGKRLRIATLESDREAQALADPFRRETELVHAVWKRACRKRRPLHYTDRENISAAVGKLGLRACLRAVAGACYDPNTKRLRNGRVHPYQDLDLIFRTFGKVAEFAARAPSDWQPDPAKVAAIGKESPDWIAKVMR